MAREHRRLALLLLGLASAAAPAEPNGYWTGPMAGDVPATLAGASALADAPSARAWIQANHPVLVDVAPAPRKPASMAPGMPWLPAAHQDIPHSVWLPDAGRLLLSPERADSVRRVLQHLAGPPPGRPLLVYCHPKCWASWNAARLLVHAGYTRIAWFPGGIEGWAAAGYNLQGTQPTPY